MSEAQTEAVEAFQRLGSIRKAAAEIGKAYSTTHGLIKRWQEAQLRAGEVPDGYAIDKFTTQTGKNGEIKGRSQRVVREGGDRAEFYHVPDPKAVKFTTTNLDSSLRVKSQWVREEKDAVEKAKLWAGYTEELLKPVVYIEPVTKLFELGGSSLVQAKDNLAVYPIGDYHIGMLAWGAETRSDSHDLHVSETLLQEAAETLMDAAPPCETAVLAFMGDFIHFDSFRPETPKSKNLMDTDSRFGKVGRTAMRVVRHVIAAARRRHRHVHVIWLRGNHDESVAELIKGFLGMFYEGEKGISIDSSPSYFSYYEWGNNLFGFAHGDKLKPEKMPMVMATDQHEAWGRCELRTIFTAHLHQKEMTDEYGVILEKVPVIIPGDAYSVNAGYRSRRRMEVVVYDREFGETERKVYNPARFYRGR